MINGPRFVRVKIPLNVRSDVTDVAVCSLATFNCYSGKFKMQEMKLENVAHSVERSHI